MQLQPYLTFDRQCRAAFESYQAVLGGQLSLVTHAESPAAAHAPPGMEDAIMHARLQVGDAVLMGSDAPPEYFTQPGGFSVTIAVDAVAEAERIFAALAEGGTVKMPLQETFWADRFGMFVDRFGTPWMVNCTGSKTT